MNEKINKKEVNKMITIERVIHYNNKTITIKDVDKLVEACQELLLSIGENTIDLWDANLNYTHSSILWDGGEVTTDYDKGEKTEFEGISEAHAKLYNLLKEMGIN